MSLKSLVISAIRLREPDASIAARYGCSVSYVAILRSRVLGLPGCVRTRASKWRNA